MLIAKKGGITHLQLQPCFGEQNVSKYIVVFLVGKGMSVEFLPVHNANTHAHAHTGGATWRGAARLGYEPPSGYGSFPFPLSLIHI